MRSPTSTTPDEIAPVEPLADGAFRVSARLPVEDLGELFDVEIDDDDVDTVGGLLAQRSAGCRCRGHRWRATG